MSEETQSYHPWLTILVAIIVVAAGTAAYVYFGRVPTPYSGQLQSVNIYPIHENLDAPTTTGGIGGQGDVFDEILVLVNVHIKNVAKIPLYLDDMSAITSFPGATDHASGVSDSDFNKLFVAYPALNKYKMPPLRRNITIQPGQQVDGLMIFSYQMDQNQWNTNTGMDVHVSFVHQNPLILHIPASQIHIAAVQK